MRTGLNSTEAELGKRIVYMHDVLKMGFRKISKKLDSEGISQVGKDRVNRLYWKHKALEAVDVEDDDEELTQLGELEREAEKKAEIAAKKSEKRWRIAASLVQEADASFERRQELFENKMVLVDFAETVLLVVNPTLWLRLNKFCKTEKIDLADAIQDAVGSQINYEKSRMEAIEEDNEYLLDEHLCLQIENWLLEQQNEEFGKEETEALEALEPEIIIEDEEFAYILMPWDSQDDA